MDLKVSIIRETEPDPEHGLLLGEVKERERKIV